MDLYTSKLRAAFACTGTIANSRLAALTVAAMLAGCGTPDDPDTQAAALARAQANVQLRQSLDALGKAGWEAELVAASSVERYQAPAGTEPGAAAPSSIWTRVKFPVLLRATADRPEARGDLIVAWPDQGADVFAVAPRDEAASRPLLDALPSGDPRAVPAADDSAESDGTIDVRSSALACGRALNETCSSSLRCCRGLACTAYSYYSRCSCGKEYTVNYPERTTTSSSCPASAAWIRRYRRGCAANGAWNLDANACGDGVSVPAYQLETWTVLICGRVFC